MPPVRLLFSCSVISTEICLIFTDKPHLHVGVALHQYSLCELKEEPIMRECEHTWRIFTL